MVFSHLLFDVAELPRLPFSFLLVKRGVKCIDIIVVLRKNKPKDRKGKITLVNASTEFKKGQPKNFIPDDGIRKITEAFNAGQNVDGFVKIITTAEAAKNDFNLSPSRYLATGATVTYRPVPVLLNEMSSLDQAAAELSHELTKLLKKVTA